jgi:hypothetical protein
MGGGERREQYRDFTNRYDEGAPYDRISGEIAMSRYAEVAPNLSDDEYRESAREAFSRMDLEERAARPAAPRAGLQQGHDDFIDRDHDAKTTASKTPTTWPR